VLTFVVWPLLAAFAMERVVRHDGVAILGRESLPVGIAEIGSTFVVVSLTALGKSSPGWLAGLCRCWYWLLPLRQRGEGDAQGGRREIYAALD